MNLKVSNRSVNSRSNPPELNLGSDLTQPNLDEHIDTTQAPESYHRKRRFGFSIHHLHFLVEEGLYCELLVDIDIAPIPNSPAHVRGLVNLRGNIITAYSIHGFIGENKSKAKYAYLIGAPQDGAALLVDNKPKLVDLSDSSEENAFGGEIPELLTSSLEHTYSVGNETWHSLNHVSLFSKLAVL